MGEAEKPGLGNSTSRRSRSQVHPSVTGVSSEDEVSIGTIGRAFLPDCWICAGCETLSQMAGAMVIGVSVVRESSWGGLSQNGAFAACGWEKPGLLVAARRSQDSTSDDELLVRPNVGRDVVPRRQDRHREDVTVGSRGCMETLLDGLQEDLAVGDSEIMTTQTDLATTHSVGIAPTQMDTQEGTLPQTSRRLVLIGGGGASQNRANLLAETPGRDQRHRRSAPHPGQRWRCWWSQKQMVKRKDQLQFSPSRNPSHEGGIGIFGCRGLVGSGPC